MTAARVRIRRQALQVYLQGTQAEGLALQRRLPQCCADVLSPALESALAAVDPGEAYLVLDRLDLELTVTSLDSFDSELADAVRRELAEHFRRHPPPTAGPVRVPVRGPLPPDEPKPWAEEPADPVRDEPPDRWRRPPPASTHRDGAQHRTSTEATEDALVTFLRTGALPWWFRLPPGRTLAQEVLDSWHPAPRTAQFVPALRRSLLGALTVGSARLRLVRQFDRSFVGLVLSGLSPPLARVVDDVLATLRPSPPALTRRFVPVVHEAALDALATGAAPPTPDALVRAAWAIAHPMLRADDALAETLERYWTGSTREPETRAAAVAREHAQPSPAPGRTEAEEASGVLVDHAGVVLLHPFLPRFFNGLGVAEGDELVDPERALCLLHHLVTGESSAPEHRLVLAKALCGVPADEPVEADVGMTDDETAEATALLEAVTGHWEALRGSSPDALRVEFLQRPGVLRVTGDGDWLLRVESRTVDILLDQLPWGYSSFRLPWMRRLMIVEWR